MGGVKCTPEEGHLRTEAVYRFLHQDTALGGLVPPPANSGHLENQWHMSPWHDEPHLKQGLQPTPPTWFPSLLGPLWLSYLFRTCGSATLHSTQKRVIFKGSFPSFKKYFKNIFLQNLVWWAGQNLGRFQTQLSLFNKESMANGAKLRKKSCLSWLQLQHSFHCFF